MSLSFPPSPTIGQVYNGLIWDGVKWASPQGPAGLAQRVLEVTLAANTAANTVGWKTVLWDTRTIDVQNAYANGLFTPRQAGLYLVTATIAMAMPANANMGVAIVKNGSVANAESMAQWFAQVAAQNGAPLNVSALIYCNGTTDTISAQGYINTGTSGIFYSPGNAQSWVGMVATLLGVGPAGPAGAPGPGSRILLASASVNPASPVATVDFPNVFTTAYDQFELDWCGLACSAAASLFGYFTADGSTWISGASNYSYAQTYSNSNNTGGFAGGNASSLLLANSGALASQLNCDGLFRIPLPWTTDRYKFASGRGQIVGSAGVFDYSVANFLNGNYAGYITSAIKGIRLTPASGTITRGAFNIYGIMPGAQRAQ